ncbi:uncharacterized protein LOC124138293 [Haliotis rufescens]|uniref:uncharacterized protein LOC124138293 n=1 Tax=Haliotis rufescens TaxID=6454 RepID=UPI00201F632D|nr:uncharacterized protein LOC124138293 [Haliotis rufescens]
MVVVVAVSVVAPLLLLVVVLIKCLGCLRKKEGFKTFENEDSRMEARINPGFAMGQDVDTRDQTMSTTIQIEPLPELLAESTPRKPKIACVEKTKQEAAFKLVVINNPHPFPRRQLTYLKEIGTGWFGQVLESDAEHITTGIPLSRVVAKVLRDDASNSEKKLFLEDVVPYRELEHSNVLRLLGQCTESAPYLMILEYAQMGDLKTCVKKLKDRAEVMMQNYQVVKFAIDAASGLACLHRHGYIHQDFAARNCVVMSDYTVKIGDYGISEDVFKDDYFVSGKESLPIRWMAPESLSQQSGNWQTAVITREANIWSFGVLLWEMLMFGKQPYGNMADDQVLQTVIADRMVKLPEPDVNILFKDRIVEVMLFCWLNPGQRPSIEDAHGLLQRLYEIVAGDQTKAENFEKKWNQMIPHEARIVAAKPQHKQQTRPASASFDSNFVPDPKPEPQQPVSDQPAKAEELFSVKIEDNMSTSVTNGDHIAVNMQPSLAGKLAQLPTPSRHTLPAHMTSTPIMDLAPTPAEPDVSQKQQKSGSGSRTSRKIEDEFSVALAASTKSNSSSLASPVPSEEKTPDVLIDVPKEDTAADLLGALDKEEDLPVSSDQFDLLGGKPVVSPTKPASSLHILEAVGEPLQDVQNQHNTLASDIALEGNKPEQAPANNKDPFADLFGQGDIADQIKPVSSQPDASAELLPGKGNQSLLSESSSKGDAESPVSGFDEPYSKADPAGKQTASSDTKRDTDVEPQNFLSNDIDLVSSRNFQAESIIPSTFQSNERLADEPVSKGENVKPSDLALDNGTSGYETPADQSVKSDSNEENTSGAESSSDSAVCVSSPELADAPSSFDGAAPSGEKVGTCVEYVSDDESKSSSSESDSSSDSSNSGSSYVCEDRRRHIQVTDLDADDDDSDNLDERQDNISDEVTDSDEDLDLRLASELYLSKGVSSPRVFERPPLETIPEDVMPSPSDTSSVDLKFDAHFDDVFASQDNFEWDDFMGESIVGRDRTSNTPKASFDMSDWLMDGDSLSYRSSGSIQSPLESVSPDILGTSDPSIRLSTASTSEVKRQRGRTSRSYVSDLITNRSIHDSFTNTKNTRTPFYSLFDNVDMDSDSDTNLSPESNQPESRLTETAPAGLHDKVEDLASGSRTDDSLFIQQPSLSTTDPTLSVETSVSSASVLEADVTNQKLPGEQQTEVSPDPSDNLEGLGGIDKGKGNVSRQGQPKKKPVPEDLESAFEELASQHGIDLFGSGEVSNISDNQYNEFSFESLGKSSDVNLFDDFVSPDTNDTSHKPEVPSVAAFFTGLDIPTLPVAPKTTNAALVKAVADDSFSKETVVSLTASSSDLVSSEVDSSCVIHTEKSELDGHENEKNEFIKSENVPNEDEESDSDPGRSDTLTEPALTDRSGSDEHEKTQQFTDPESSTVSFSDLDAADSFQVLSYPGQSVDATQIPSISNIEFPAASAAALVIDMTGIPNVSDSFLQTTEDNMTTDSLTQLGESFVNIDVPSIHTEAPDLLEGSYEADVHADSEASVEQEGSDITNEESFSFTIEPQESPQGKETYESADNNSFDMVETASDVDNITESLAYSMDELNESEITVECKPLDSVLSNSSPSISSSVEIGNPSTDAVRDSMPYGGTDANPDMSPADAYGNRDEGLTGDVESHDVAGISGGSLVVVDTEKDNDTFSALEKQTLSTESNSPKEDFETVFRHSDTDLVPDTISDKNELEITAKDYPNTSNTAANAEKQDLLDGKTDVGHHILLQKGINTEDKSVDHISQIGAETNASIGGTDKAVDVISGPGPIHYNDAVTEGDSEGIVSEIGLYSQSPMAIEQTKVDDHDVLGQELSSSSSEMEEDVQTMVSQQTVNQTDVFEGLVTDQSAVIEKGSDTQGSLITQDNDVSVKPSNFQADIFYDNLSPVQAFDNDEIPATSISSILSEDAIDETDTEKEIHGFRPDALLPDMSPEQHQLPPSKDSDFTGLEDLEQISVPDDLPSVSEQLIDKDKILDESSKPQDQLLGVNIAQQVPSSENNDFTGLQGFEQIPVPNDLPSVPDSEQLTCLADHISHPDISIDAKESTAEVSGSSGMTSNVFEPSNVDDFGQAFILGKDSLKQRTSEQNDAPEEVSWASDVSEAGSDNSLNDFEDLGMTTSEQVVVSQQGDGSAVSTDSLLDDFVEISNSVGEQGFLSDISETSETQAKSDSQFTENTEVANDGETVEERGDEFLVLGASEEEKQTKFYSDGSNESNLGQSVIDFPDSSLTDSQESAAFLDLPSDENHKSPQDASTFKFAPDIQSQSNSQEGLEIDNDEFGMSETKGELNTASPVTIAEINIDTDVLCMSPPIATSQTEEDTLKPNQNVSSDLKNMHPSSQDMMADSTVSDAAQVIISEGIVSISPTEDIKTSQPSNTITPINNQATGIDDLTSEADPVYDAFPSVETVQTVDSEPFGLASGENTVPSLEASDAFPSVETVQTADSDPFGLTSATGENTVPNLEASDAFPSVETEQTGDSDSFGLTSGENTVPNLEASDAFTLVETEQTADSDPFGLTSGTGENTAPNLEAPDAFPSVETVQTGDSDPFGLTSGTGENIVPNLEASDAFPSVETVQTADSDPFGLTSGTGENTVPNLEASDAFTLVETGQTQDSDPFGLTSATGENTAPNLEASDAFPSVETVQTADSDPFGLTSATNVNAVPNLETSDAFPSVETVQTADSGPFGLTSATGENTAPNLEASDAFPSVETVQTADSDPFGLTSATNVNAVPNLETSDAFPSVETVQTADSDPFGLTSATGENTVPNLEASDAFTLVETEQTADSDPFGLTSTTGENTVPNLEASDAFPSVETVQTADSDPFGLTSGTGENTVPNLEASDAFTLVETEQTADSDPFGLTPGTGEDTVPNLEASDAFTLVATEQTADSDSFGLTSGTGENTVPNLEAPDAFPSVETVKTADSGPFDLTSASGEVTVPNLETLDAFPSVETGQTQDSDPFGLTSATNVNAVPNLETPDAFPSVETVQTADSDPFGLTSATGENTVPNLEASDAFTLVETEQTEDSDPFGLPSATGEDTVPNLEASDAFTLVATEQTADSDPFGLTSGTGENTVPNLEAPDAFPSVETVQTADRDPFGLTSGTGENTVPNLEAPDAFPSVETVQTGDSDPFGLTSGENTVPNLEASDAFTLVETEQTADSDPFGLTSATNVNAVPNLEAPDAFPSVETVQTADSDPFGLTSATGENTVPNLEASDAFPSVETVQTGDSDPFGLTSGENTVPNLEASDAFTLVETEQTADSDPFGLTSATGENTAPNLETLDAFPSVETEQTADSDPFGLTSTTGENIAPNLEASDAFPSVETVQTGDSDPFGLTSAENTAPNLEASDAFPSVETVQTADSGPFGLTSASGEDTVPNLETLDAFPTVETGQTQDSDPFGLTSATGENTAPNLEASDAFPSVETVQTADSDPFGLTSGTGENTVPNLEASDAFPSVETVQTADSDPFGLTSGENTAPNLEASDAFPSVETVQTADSDPFGLTSGENTVPNLEASDAFTFVETEQTADSGPFGLTSATGENTAPNLQTPDAFPSVETGQTADSDPFGLTSGTGENTVPNLEASDAFTLVETGQTQDSDPFGLTSATNVSAVPNLEAPDAFPSVETVQTADSDPFGLTSATGENTAPNLETPDAFPSVETEQTEDSDPFGVTSATGENTVPNLEALDAFTSVETVQTADSDPFGLTSGENTVPNLEAPDAFPSVETVQTEDSDPFGLTSATGEDTVPNLETLDAFPSVETGQTEDSDPFGLTSAPGEDTVPNLETLDAFPSVEAGQTEDSDPFGLTSATNVNAVPNLEAPDAFPSVEPGETQDSDPFGLTSATGENTAPNLEASDAFPSVETVQTEDSDPFGLSSATGEDTVPNLEASDAFTLVETGQTADSDPFGLTSASNVNAVPNLEAPDAFPSVESGQTQDSDPFGVTSATGEDTVPNLEASDAFTLVKTGKTADSDPFGLTSATGEKTAPNLKESDAFPSVETVQTADSDPFGLTSGENTVPNLEAPDAFPSVETVQTEDSDPFGLTSATGENTAPNLETLDAFPSVETGQTQDSDPFGLTSATGENAVPNLEAPDAFPSVETVQTEDSDPFGLTSAIGENTAPNLETLDAFPSVETGQTQDSDPFGLKSATGENTAPNLGAARSFPSVIGNKVNIDPFGLSSSQDNTVPCSVEPNPSAETSQIADSDPFGMTALSQNDTVPNLSTSNTFPSVETGQTADSDPFGLTLQVDPSQLETGDMFDFNSGNKLGSGAAEQSPMTVSGMLLDFVQAGSEAPSRANSGTSADMFGSSLDFSSSQDLSQSAADTKESDQSALLDMFEKPPPSTEVEPQKSDTSSLVDLF